MRNFGSTYWELNNCKSVNIKSFTRLWIYNDSNHNCQSLYVLY